MRCASFILLIVLTQFAVCRNSLADNVQNKPAGDVTFETGKQSKSGWEKYPPTIRIFPLGFEVTIAVTVHPETDAAHLSAITSISLEDDKGYLLGQRMFSSDQEIREAEFTVDTSKTEMTAARITVTSSIDGPLVHDFSVNTFGETVMGTAGPQGEIKKEQPPAGNK